MMKAQLFLTYATATLTFVLVGYSLIGGVLWVGTVSIPTAALVGTVALTTVMVLISN